MATFGFEPWVGKNYGTVRGRQLRLLVLGEAHYIDDPALISPKFTQWVVTDWTQGSKRSRFFTVLTNLLLPSSGTWTVEEQAGLWQGVAFYNYVQEPVGKTAGVRPTTRMWSDSVPAFERVLRELRPERMLVCGKELWWAISGNARKFERVSDGIAFPAGAFSDTLAMPITHPSARGGSNTRKRGRSLTSCLGH